MVPKMLIQCLRISSIALQRLFCHKTRDSLSRLLRKWGKLSFLKLDKTVLGGTEYCQVNIICFLCLY